MHPKDAEGIENSVDPDQTAPLFAEAYVSENLRSLRYYYSFKGGTSTAFTHEAIPH